jgi:hypothetical protein
VHPTVLITGLRVRVCVSSRDRVSDPCRCQTVSLQTRLGDMFLIVAAEDGREGRIICRAICALRTQHSSSAVRFVKGETLSTGTSEVVAPAKKSDERLQFELMAYTLTSNCYTHFQRARPLFAFCTNRTRPSARPDEPRRRLGMLCLILGLENELSRGGNATHEPGACSFASLPKPRARE